LVGQPAEAVRAALDGADPTTLSLVVAELPRPAADAVTAAGLPGVLVVPAPRRTYPTGPLLAPVMGFVGIATPQEEQRWPDLPPGEFVGRAGLELQYDAVLRGVNGGQCVYVDPKGVPVAMGKRVEPVPGASLRTSLDVGLQRRLTDTLQAALRAQPRRSAVAAAVALDARNGRSSRWRASRPTTTTSTVRPSTRPRCRPRPPRPATRCWRACRRSRCRRAPRSSWSWPRRAFSTRSSRRSG